MCVFGIELAWNVDFTPVNPQVYRPQVNTIDDRNRFHELENRTLVRLCLVSMPTAEVSQKLKYTVVIGEKGRSKKSYIVGRTYADRSDATQLLSCRLIDYLQQTKTLQIVE